MANVADCQTILDELLAAVGFEDAPLNRLTIIDDGNALPSPWPITANAVAALAAVGLAASRFGELRGGRAADVTVRTFHAGLSMASSSYLTVDGKPAKFRDPFTGFYEAADGRWAFLHGNFPHLRDGVLSLLGVSHVKDVAEAVARRDAFELEALGISHGLCIASVRTRAEWEAEASFEAAKNLPLIELVRMGEGTPTQTPGEQPLAGIRMLDLSRVIAGPMTGRTIAEFGAEVQLISGPELPFIESLVIDTGFGKRSAILDLSSAEGRETFDALVAEADIVLDAYRPGSLRGRGFDRLALAQRRPGLIHLDINAFPRLGPWALRRGYDSLVQATTGMCWDGVNPPENLPCQPLDYLTGYLGALTAMVGLIRRIEGKTGWSGRLSLTQTAQWMWDTYDRLGPETDYPAEKIAIDDARKLGYLASYETEFGTVEALRSPLQSADWRWPYVPVRLGSHAPGWST